MQTKETILQRIDELKTAAPAMEESFALLAEAVEQFFEPTGELKNLVANCAFQMAFNYEYRHSTYENQEAMDIFRMDDLPMGYDDVRLLLDESVWGEMLTVEEEDLTPSLLADWISRIEAAKESLVTGLEAIDSYCEVDATKNGTAIHFENFGRLLSVPSKEEVAERVYVEGGYLDIIRGFGLDVFVPSNLRQ